MEFAPLQLTVHTTLGSPEAPASAAVEAAKVWRLDEYAELGHGDFASSPRELAAVYADTETSRWAMLLAHRGEACVGLASVQIPDADNRHMLAIDLRLDPTAEPTAVLDELWQAVIDLGRAEARDTVIVWLASRQPGEMLIPRTGAGAVRRTPITDWLRAHGFDLEQVEVASTLDVRDALTRTAWDAAGAQESPEYDMVSWMGATPPELQDALAEQRARMSTDVPLGDVAMGPELWDAARVRAEDELLLAMGRSQAWTLAVERASGAVVAHTVLICPEEWLPEVAFQEDTLVRRDHRGHGLGLRIKAANLRQLAGRRPGVRRIHTWNADENEWMLAINRQLGFRPTSTLGCWQWQRR